MNENGKGVCVCVHELHLWALEMEIMESVTLNNNKILVKCVIILYQLTSTYLYRGGGASGWRYSGDLLLSRKLHALNALAR